MKRLIGTALCMAGIAVAAPTFAACTATTVATQMTNCGPQSSDGTPVIDLAGTPIPVNTANPYTPETATFTATSGETTITLAFRNDAGYWDVADTSLTTGGGGNLLVDGNFAASPYLGPSAQSLPTGWKYSYQGETTSSNPGIGAAGGLAGCDVATTGPTPSVCWRDGAVGGYDQIWQNVATTPGALYSLSFLVNSSEDSGTAQQLAGNGQQAADVIAYEAPTPQVVGVAEPGAPGLLALGLGALGLRRRARR